MTDYWLDNAASLACNSPHHAHILVDVGYGKEQSSRDRADRLLTMVSERNLCIVANGANGRILIRIPPTKLEKVLAAFPEITKGDAGYCWCSHGWLDKHEDAAKDSDDR